MMLLELLEAPSPNISVVSRFDRVSEGKRTGFLVKSLGEAYLLMMRALLEKLKMPPFIITFVSLNSAGLGSYFAEF